MTWLDIPGLVPGACVPVHVSVVGQMMIKITEVPRSTSGVIKLQYLGQRIYRSSPDDVAMSGPQNTEEEMLTRMVVTLDPWCSVGESGFALAGLYLSSPMWLFHFSSYSIILNYSFFSLSVTCLTGLSFYQVSWGNPRGIYKPCCLLHSFALQG